VGLARISAEIVANLSAYASTKQPTPHLSSDLVEGGVAAGGEDHRAACVGQRLAVIAPMPRLARAPARRIGQAVR
jgi:hypothetical protein